MSILSSVLFIFTNELDADAECFFRKSADDKKLEGLADTPDVCAAIQRALNKLWNWADKNLMEINKGKYEVLPHGEISLSTNTSLGPITW